MELTWTKSQRICSVHIPYFISQGLLYLIVISHAKEEHFWNSRKNRKKA